MPKDKYSPVMTMGLTIWPIDGLFLYNKKTAMYAFMLISHSVSDRLSPVCSLKRYTSLLLPAHLLWQIDQRFYLISVEMPLLVQIR